MATPPPPPAPTPALPDQPVVETSLDIMGKINAQLGASIKQVSELVEKGLVKALLAIGILLILAGGVMRILSSIPQISTTFTTIDMLTWLSFGAIFLLVGSAVKMYEFKKVTEWSSQNQRTSLFLAEKAHGNVQDAGELLKLLIGRGADKID